MPHCLNRFGQSLPDGLFVNCKLYFRKALFFMGRKYLEITEVFNVYQENRKDILQKHSKTQKELIAEFRPKQICYEFSCKR